MSSMLTSLRKIYFALANLALFINKGIEGKINCENYKYNY